MVTKKFLIFIFIIVFFTFSYGVVVGHYQFSPYFIFKEINTLVNNFNVKNEVQTIEIFEENIESLIQIDNYDDIVEKRNLLVKYIWKDNGFPKLETPLIENEILDQNYADLSNLKKIEKISIPMKYDVNSVIYHFVAKNSNDKLVIYHQGHSGDFVNGKNTIQFFLDKGYSVLAFSMPLLGMNNQPIVETEFGKIKLNSHKNLQLLDSPDFSSIVFFLEPIAVSLNYLEKNYSYSDYSFIGISGGGWTATLYSAIDSRISKTFSVAGSVPFFMRSMPENIGDYEQNLPSLYSIANYLDLYIMSSAGENRKFVQIFNKFDPCCFSGNTFPYSTMIENIIQKIGSGDYEIFIDDSHMEHKISENSLKIILNSIETTT